PLARHRAAEPRPARQPGVHRRLVLRTRQAIPRQPLPPRVSAVRINAARVGAARVNAARSGTTHALPPPRQTSLRQTPTTPNAHHAERPPRRTPTTPTALHDQSPPRPKRSIPAPVIA